MPVLSWFQIGAGAIAAFALSWLLHTVDVDRLEAQQRAALEDQAVKLKAACEADKQITKDANDALQKQNDIIAGKLNAAKRLHAARCVVPTVTGKAILPADDGKHAGQNGISSDWLRDYAAQCESIRQTGLTCIKFIDDTWQANASHP